MSFSHMFSDQRKTQLFYHSIGQTIDFIQFKTHFPLYITSCDSHDFMFRGENDQFTVKRRKH